MTISPESRRLLPVATKPSHARGKRVAATCRWKCADACSHPVANRSANEYFRDVAAKAMSRRVMLGGAAVAAGAVVVGATALNNESPAQAGTLAGHGGGHGKGLSFGPIETQDASVDALVVPEGYEWSPIIRWGDPILPGGHAFDPAAQSPEQQKRQFGYNVDYLNILPSNPRDMKDGVQMRRGRRGLLVTNHEYTNRDIMFDADLLDTPTGRAIERAAHGMSVVEVVRRREGSPWDYLRVAPRNRRIHMDTEFVIDGPAAGHELMRTAEDPTGTKVRGTLNNCAGGTTPWGTVLSGEENWNGYFVVAAETERTSRYGLTTEATGYAWELDEPRFAGGAGYENEPHRFGWIVELDPYDPGAPPVKHTAMGRFKHEGANVVVAPDGHVVAYMGDDERFDYVYKFVSKHTVRNGDDPRSRAHNKKLLSEGNLYVARFTGDSPAEEFDGSGALPSDGAFDGTGEWLPLVVDGESAVEGMPVEEVLMFTRLAADTVGATKMDRPEDVEPSPFTGNVYVACTNNSDRGIDGNEGATEMNPRNENRDGHIVEIVEGDEQTGTEFTWNLLLVAGDPSVNDSTYFSGFPADKVSPISCPDNVAFDTDGNLWISTDGQPSSIAKCDGVFRVMLDGPERGKVEQFLSTPRSSEACGPLIDVRDEMVYVNVQHPGDDGTFTEHTSFFPDYVPAGTEPEIGSWRGARPSTVQVYRKKRGNGHGRGDR